MLVPTMTFATGSMATISTMNGIERKTFTIMPSARFSQRIGRMPPSPVTASTTPSGSPTI